MAHLHDFTEILFEYGKKDSIIPESNAKELVSDSFIEKEQCKISIDKLGNLYISNCKEIALNPEEIRFIDRLKKIFKE